MNYSKDSNQCLAYLLFRITVGVNFLAHGMVRLPKIEGFRSWMIAEFQQSIVPSFVVSSFASVLPFIELTIGLFLVLGILTRYTLLASFVLMASLIFGSCLIEQWEFVGFQMIYAICLYLLLLNLPHNAYQISNLFNLGKRN